MERLAKAEQTGRSKFMNAVTQKERPETTARLENFLSPPVNIYETQDGYMLEAEMPGVAKDGLEVLLEGNTITLIGHRHQEAPKADAIYRESRQASYRREFELDPAIDTSQIKAEMKQGILTVQLPKAEKVKPRKITVD
jgi:HSP20 family protein